MLDRADIIRELIRRKRCQESLTSYAMNVPIPTVPGEPMCPDEDLLGPASQFMAKHHAVMLDAIQRTMLKPYGRLILMLPPGSAKSLYASVVGATWFMGKFPGSRLLVTSYSGGLAEKNSRRAMQLVESQQYRDIWEEAPVITKDAAHEWHLSTHSEYLAMGLMGGLTGNRANGWIIDDPVAGREEADSETTSQKTYDAYKDDLLTRSLPGAWGILILTRWHELDLAGRILPEDYKGESGIVIGTDGLEWEVLNIPAKCERHDDPLGRKIGEYIWPEFYPARHWQMFENAKGAEAARTWASLYQQRPTPVGAGRFHESMFHFYQEGEQPPNLAHVGAGDYAVTTGKNDFSEIGIFGVDSRGDLWERDWWNEQCDTGKSANQTLDMCKRWKVGMFFNEGGVIDKAMGPLFNLLRNMRAREGKAVHVDIRAVPSMQDKLAKCAAFQARCASGGERGDGTWNPGSVHLRDNANSRRIVAQLCGLGATRFDDAADVCGNIGRALDQFPIVYTRTHERKKGLVPFSAEWLEYQEEETRKRQYR